MDKVLRQRFGTDTADLLRVMKVRFLYIRK